MMDEMAYFKICHFLEYEKKHVFFWFFFSSYFIFHLMNALLDQKKYSFRGKI